MIKVDFRSATSMAMTFCATILFLGMMSAIQAATQYDYIATTTAENATEQGPVQAGKLTWICKGNQCGNSNARSAPDLGDCKALAQKVGFIASYGYKGNWLTQQQLAICNKVIQEPSPSPDVVQAVQEHVKESIPVGPNTDQNSVQNPAPTATQSTSEASATLRKSSSEALRDKSPYSTAQVLPETAQVDVQNPAISSKLSEAKKAQANEDLRFLQARDRLREGNVIIDGGSIFVYLR